MVLIKKLAFVFIILFLFFSLTKNLFDFQKNRRFYADFQNDYEAEKRKNAELKTELARKKDPFETEKIIRNKLNMQKPGESIIILPPPTIIASSPTPTPLPNYQQWIDAFFKIE